jgi:hypothetical protein
MGNELVKSEAAQISKPEPTVADMLAAVIERGVTSENVAAVGELVKLYERMEEKKAEKQFAAAFVELQKELPTINGYRPIPDKQGRTKFCYANFEDIDAIVRPYCLQNGFTYSFHESAIEAGRVTVTMTLQHSGGHSRPIPYSVRIGSGPPGASESQADVSGHTYAQRGALEAGLALRIIGRPEDARMEGGLITKEQADELERRVKETNSDRKRFLAYAGAKSYAEIRAAMYPVLDGFLSRKEKAGK